MAPCAVSVVVGHPLAIRFDVRRAADRWTAHLPGPSPRTGEGANDGGPAGREHRKRVPLRRIVDPFQQRHREIREDLRQRQFTSVADTTSPVKRDR